MCYNKSFNMSSIFGLIIPFLAGYVICIFGQPSQNQAAKDAAMAQTVLMHIKPILDSTACSQEMTIKTTQQALDARLQNMEDLINSKLFLEDFGMLLDHRTLYETRYMSFDSLTIFNRPFPPPSGHNHTRYTNIFSHNWPTGNNRLQNYRGVLGTKAVSYPNKVCLEVDLSYYIENTLDHLDFISEIAFATHDVVDMSSYVGKQTNAWSLQFYNDNNVVRGCETAGTTTNIHIVGPVNAGARNKIEIGVIVDTRKQTITYVDRQTNAIMCRYSNVNTNEDLWPTFAVYAASKSQVNMTLKRSYYHPDSSWIYV